MSTKKILTGILLGLVSIIAGCATTTPPSATKTAVLPTATKPVGKGVYHKVHPGETLWRIAQTYGVGIDEVIKSNNIPNVAKIEKDQLIFIPGADEVRTVTIPEKGPKDNDFQWPIKGTVISYFGNHKGLDVNRGIDIQASEGEVVKAARSGKVVFADYLNGYAYTVIVAHSDGYHSVYAQNSKLLVGLDEAVDQGKPVAQVGKKGDLAFEHFEIRRNARADNPLFYLPQ